MSDENKIVDLINSEEVYELFKDAVKRSLDNLKQIERLKNSNKYISTQIKEGFGVPTKFFNSVVKHAYKNGISEELEFLSEIEEVINQLMQEDEEEYD